MNYQISLNNGQQINLHGVEFDVEAFTKSLNSPEVQFVNLGGVIVNKHIILSITPVQVQE